MLFNIDINSLRTNGIKVSFDIKPWLYKEKVLYKNDFEKKIQEYNWEKYKDNFIALYCSRNVIIPKWTYFIFTTKLQPYAKKIIIGTLNDLENILFQEKIEKIDISLYYNKHVIIKGCNNNYYIPDNAYILLIQKLQPIVKSIRYGEACNSISLYKKNI